MAIYTLEYKNEQEEIEVLRFNSTTQTFQLMETETTTDKEGIQINLPDDDQVIVGYETQNDNEYSMCQVIGEFRSFLLPEHDDKYERVHHAYEMIRDLNNRNKIVEFMNTLISDLKKNEILDEEGKPIENSTAAFGMEFDVKQGMKH